VTYRPGSAFGSNTPAPGGTYKGGVFAFGAGIRSPVYYFMLKLDAAWNTDFNHTSQPHWHFSIGPEF